VNINPDVARKVDMLRNAIWVAQRLGFVRPKVAVLAAVEKINAKDMPATADAAILAKMGESGQIAGADIAVPMRWTSRFPRKRPIASTSRGRWPAAPTSCSAGHQLGEHSLQVAGLLRGTRDRQRDDRREDALVNDLPFGQLADESFTPCPVCRFGGGDSNEPPSPYPSPKGRGTRNW